jgi:hypothetical protein
LTLDSFHSLSRNIPSASIGDIRAEKLFIVQWADAPRLQWTCSTGAAISAACRVRATLRWPNWPRNCCASAMTAMEP